MKKFVSIIFLVLLAVLCYGQSNEATTHQMGVSNEAIIEQIGKNHQAYIYQTGDDNVAEIEQTHDRNWAEVKQYNHDNKVFIDQVWGSDKILLKLCNWEARNIPISDSWAITMFSGSGKKKAITGLV